MCQNQRPLFISQKLQVPLGVSIILYLFIQPWFWFNSNFPPFTDKKNDAVTRCGPQQFHRKTAARYKSGQRKTKSDFSSFLQKEKCYFPTTRLSVLQDSQAIHPVKQHDFGCGVSILGTQNYDVTYLKLKVKGIKGLFYIF